MVSPYLLAAARAAGSATRAAGSATRAAGTARAAESAPRAESATRASGRAGGCWRICALPLSAHTAVDLYLSGAGDIILAAAPANPVRVREVKTQTPNLFLLRYPELDLIVQGQSGRTIAEHMAGRMFLPEAGFVQTVAENLAARRACLRMILPDGRCAVVQL